jgi:hypothetical protein
MAKFRMMVVAELPTANSYLLEPYQIGEKVMVSDYENPDNPDTLNEQMINVKRLKTKSNFVERIKDFKDVKNK